MAVPDALDRLAAELGPAFTADPAALAAYRTDKSGWTTPETPLAAVRARSIEDVQAAMRIASEHGIPVVPRGAGTGLAGGAVGTAGTLVLDVAAMDRVLEIHAADEIAVVQPGVVTDDLAATLAPHGLWWPPDPASRAISTVGGNIATNAGGLLCAKYGVTRESVLGLEVVLADGTLVRTGHRTVKGVTGYDLTALMIGSEGTLGIVVEATLKLRRRSADPVVTIGAGFPTVVEAAAASAAITAAGIRCAALELLDAASCAAIDAYLADVPGMPSLAGRGAFLLVQTDGAAAADEARAVVAADRGRRRRARARRRRGGGRAPAGRCAGAPIRRSSGSGQVLIEDVAVPRTRLPAMFAAIERISADYGLPIPTVAHAGDGNLHPNLVIPPGMPHEPGSYPDVVWAAAEALFRTAMELGRHADRRARRRRAEAALARGRARAGGHRPLEAHQSRIRSPGDPQPGQGVLGRVTQPPLAAHSVRDLALLADGERGAVLSPDGNVAWLCAPRWESPAVFAHLLGGGGTFAVRPQATSVWSGSYEPGSLIFRSSWKGRGAAVDVIDALALPSNRDSLTLLRRIDATDGGVAVEIEFDVRSRYGRHRSRDVRRDEAACGTAGSPTGSGGGSAVCPTPSPIATGCCASCWSSARARGTTSCSSSGTDLPNAPLRADVAWAATEDAWRTRVPAMDRSVAPRDAQQAYAVLCGLTSQGNGMVAAATTSLPENIGGERDYDYRYTWIRDQCFAGLADAAAGGRR